MGQADDGQNGRREYQAEQVADGEHGSSDGRTNVTVAGLAVMPARVRLMSGARRTASQSRALALAQATVNSSLSRATSSVSRTQVS